MPTPELSLTPGPGQRILSALAGPGQPRSVADLSTALGVHPNTVRTALAELLTAGLVERSQAPAGGRGRPSFDYSLTLAGRNAQSTGRAFREYRSLTEAFAAHLAERSQHPGVDARAIGRSWGATLAGERAETESDADAALTDLLAELGFGPDPDQDGMALRTCPLLELAEEMPEVICQVHSGLVEGVLERHGRPRAEAELIPFAEVGACRLRLHRCDADEGPAPPAEPAPDQDEGAAPGRIHRQ